MMVIGNFGAYDIDTAMEMPYCHFVDLYVLAEKRESMRANAVYIGKMMQYDNDVRQQNLHVMRSRLKSKHIFKSVVNEKAKKKAEEIVKGM